MGSANETIGIVRAGGERERYEKGEAKGWPKQQPFVTDRFDDSNAVQF